MSTSKKIFYNTLTQSFGKVVSIVVGLLTLNLLTGYLAELGFGEYSTTLAYLGFFSALCDLGLYLVVVREISTDNPDPLWRKKIISNALGIRLVFGLVILSAGALTAQALPYSQSVKLAITIGVAAFLFGSLGQVLVGIFQKHLVTHLVTLSELCGRAINLFLVYWFVRQGLSLPYFIFSLVLANGASFLLTILLARRYEPFSLSFSTAIWKIILASAWPLAFSVVLNLAYFKGDTIILSLYRSAEAVGVYGLPYKILEVLLAFPALFVGLFMPFLSRSAFGSWPDFRALLQQAFDTLLLAIAPMVITTLFFAQPIIDLIKGQHQYQDSPALLKILIIATATIFLGTLFGYAVTAVNRQKTMIWGYLTGSVTALVLYFLLIPRYGYFGAAWGTVITEVVVALFAYFLVRKTAGGGVSLRLLPRLLPAVIILILFFKFFSLFWILEIIVGIALYGASLVVFRAVPLELIRSMLRRA